MNLLIAFLVKLPNNLLYLFTIIHLLLALLLILFTLMFGAPLPLPLWAELDTLSFSLMIIPVLLGFI
ncbi:uncharacterized protein DS421_5g145500 [Arachis hypogaea]|nr:uncharacterized protein DS421_5g145500 [Arachis hypogaea]